MSNNEHVGPVWPDKNDDYNKPLTIMDKKTEEWIAIKIKTVKMVEKFINTERHILSYYTAVVNNEWKNNDCVFVRNYSEVSYDCVNSWGK